MSKKLASQALDSLLSSNFSSPKPTDTVATQTHRRKSKRTAVVDPLPATKTGLKKIKHQLRYGHSVKRNQEEKEAKENPLTKLKSEQEKEEAIIEKNLNYYRITNRVSKKELDLRKKIKMLRARELGDRSRKAVAEADESDGEDF
ncbi:hypothetical protein BGZ83_009845 [Gryganskiella cystojenkinii]|nr:hypothetical protein BGZ83_009845 [Gryganskiella cystojenkinii]